MGGLYFPWSELAVQCFETLFKVPQALKTHNVIGIVFRRPLFYVTDAFSRQEDLYVVVVDVVLVFVPLYFLNVFVDNTENDDSVCDLRLYIWQLLNKMVILCFQDFKQTIFHYVYLIFLFCIHFYTIFHYFKVYSSTLYYTTLDYN